MDLLERAEEFEKRKMSNMSTSDRVATSREAKSLILEINEVFKETKDPHLMEVMKALTKKKQKVDKRLKGSPII